MSIVAPVKLQISINRSRSLTSPSPFQSELGLEPTSLITKRAIGVVVGVAVITGVAVGVRVGVGVGVLVGKTPVGVLVGVGDAPAVGVRVGVGVGVGVLVDAMPVGVGKSVGVAVGVGVGVMVAPCCTKISTAGRKAATEYSLERKFENVLQGAPGP